MKIIKNNPGSAGAPADPEWMRERPAHRDAQNPPEPEDAPEDTPDSLPEAWRLPPRKWFFTFMCMNIPIVGWIYLLSKAYGKKENQLKDFCRAYLHYKLVFLVISLVILGLLVYAGVEIADRVLAYMEML